MPRNARLLPASTERNELGAAVGFNRMTSSQGKKNVTPPKGKPTPARKSMESQSVRASGRFAYLQWVAFAALLVVVVVLAIMFGPEGTGAPTGGH